jgi:energy-coupling factor transport system permease protein
MSRPSALGKLLALMIPFALFGFGFLTTAVLLYKESGFALQMAREQGATSPDYSPGLALFARTLACGMLSALFALTTDPRQLVGALMTHLRLPAHVGFSLMQAMHLVPDLGREMQTMRMARAAITMEARGLRPNCQRSQMKDTPIRANDTIKFGFGLAALAIALTQLDQT